MEDMKQNVLLCSEVSTQRNLVTIEKKKVKKVTIPTDSETTCSGLVAEGKWLGAEDHGQGIYLPASK